MTLRNLVKIGRLEEHETSARQVAIILESSQRSIRDANTSAVSFETRFDAAYRSITQCAMVALWARGYRPLKSAPGHHQTMIQSLVHTIDLSSEEMQLLETFRVKRNAIDYSGEIVDITSVRECIAAAERLHRTLLLWLGKHRPDLLKK